MNIRQVTGEDIQGALSRLVYRALVSAGTDSEYIQIDRKALLAHLQETADVFGWGKLTIKDGTMYFFKGEE